MLVYQRVASLLAYHPPSNQPSLASGSSPHHFCDFKYILVIYHIFHPTYHFCLTKYLTPNKSIAGGNFIPIFFQRLMAQPRTEVLHDLARQGDAEVPLLYLTISLGHIQKHNIG